MDALDIQQQGYPVTITYPEDGVSFGIEATGVVKGGKNNAEAKKFVDWATSKKFAEFIVANKINYVPTRNDVKTSNPILDLTKIKTISVDVRLNSPETGSAVARSCFWRSFFIAD